MHNPFICQIHIKTSFAHFHSINFLPKTYHNYTLIHKKNIVPK
ncbi:hypothetical protein F383_12668 [Gossypium arboreum]|uniref:Uncharacterized protein n=1 Tax=Gossypium arboreum TaxID=29729 RepID=A0A0B0NGI5_GOSAR|nr:hypothetical protein F383_12668 [Gossypium arboreum]